MGNAEIAVMHNPRQREKGASITHKPQALRHDQVATRVGHISSGTRTKAQLTRHTYSTILSTAPIANAPKDCTRIHVPCADAPDRPLQVGYILCYCVCVCVCVYMCVLPVGVCVYRLLLLSSFMHNPTTSSIPTTTHRTRSHVPYPDAPRWPLQR